MGIFRERDLENDLNRLIASRDRCFAGDSRTCWAKEGLTLRTVAGTGMTVGSIGKSWWREKGKDDQAACALLTTASRLYTSSLSHFFDQSCSHSLGSLQFSENLTPNKRESLDFLLKMRFKPYNCLEICGECQKEKPSQNRKLSWLEGFLHE